MQLYYCVFCFILFLPLNLLAEERYSRMSGGQFATSARLFPYIVSLQKKPRGTHFCGGSILTNRFIITAAHCIDTKEPEDIRIAVGSIYKNIGQDYYDVLTMRRHDQHVVKNFKKFDFALLKTTEPIQFSEFVRPISIATSYVPDGETVTLAGWGILPGSTLQHKLRPNVLQWALLDIMNKEECEEKLRTRLDPYHICTVPGKGPCKGDSGGPLVYEGKLLGVVSYGRPRKGTTCTKVNPDIYVNVSSFINWIIRAIRTM